MLRAHARVEGVSLSSSIQRATFRETRGRRAAGSQPKERAEIRRRARLRLHEGNGWGQKNAESLHPSAVRSLTPSEVEDQSIKIWEAPTSDPGAQGELGLRGKASKVVVNRQTSIQASH